VISTATKSINFGTSTSVLPSAPRHILYDSNAEPVIVGLPVALSPVEHIVHHVTNSDSDSDSEMETETASIYYQSSRDDN